ncbi:MAG TPA: RICIN domain-containing protein [Solirubrobacteraceae bacterium]|nr:RICIN domain-containing protein [Solirubrobacteraceae bacterium]
MGSARRRIGGLLAGAAALTMALAVAVPGAALAAPASNGGSRIVGVPSGRCLDVIGGATQPGTRVQLFNCLGDPQQAWTYTGGQLQVYTGSQTLCLDADSTDNGADGTPIQVWACRGTANQRWTAEADGSLRSVAYGRCLDAVNGGQANGTRLQLWDCIGDAQQDWVGPPQPNGGGPVKGQASGRCLDVTGAGISPGTRPQLFNCLGDAQQQWLLEGGQLRVYGDKCLDATGDGTTEGTPVQIWYCLGNPQQQWTWGADGTIRSVPSGLCLDPVGQGAANGTELQLWACSGASAESWSRGEAPPPVSPPPVSTTPVPTPIPAAHGHHALRVRLVLSWTWKEKSTWLHRARIGSFPGRTRLTVRCSGRGCPRPARVTARGHRAIHRLLRRLEGRRYRSGDVVAVALTAPGYRAERARLTVRAGRKPRVRAG